MVHSGIGEAHTLLLIQAEIEVVQFAVFEQIRGPCAVLTVHERMAVGAEPYRNAFLDQDLLHAVLHELVRHIQVFGGVATGDIAQMLDGDLPALRMLGTRIVHQAHVAFQIGGTDILLPELLRCDLAIAMEHAVLVGPLPIEGDRRLAQMNGENTVTCRSGLGDDLIDVGTLGVHAGHCGVQHVAQLRVHLAGVLGRFGFREQILGHGAVLLVHVHGHGPLAAVTHHILQQMLHQAGIGGLAGCDQRGDILQEVVDTFQLVVVHGIVLRELEFLKPKILLGHETCDIQGAE